MVRMLQGTSKVSFSRRRVLFRPKGISGLLIYCHIFLSYDSSWVGVILHLKFLGAKMQMIELEMLL